MLLIAEHANNVPPERRDPVDRSLRNLIIAGNAIVWIAIITALIVSLSLRYSYQRYPRQMFQERLLRCVFSGFDLTLKLFHDRTSRTMGTLFSENSRSIAASMPADTRIYAVGDIHGRADLLIETIARIDEDRARRPIGSRV